MARPAAAPVGRRTGVGRCRARRRRALPRGPTGSGDRGARPRTANGDRPRARVRRGRPSRPRRRRRGRPADRTAPPAAARRRRRGARRRRRRRRGRPRPASRRRRGAGESRRRRGRRRAGAAAAADAAESAQDAARDARIEALVGRAESLRAPSAMPPPCSPSRPTGSPTPHAPDRACSPPSPTRSGSSTPTASTASRGSAGIVLPDGATAYLVDDGGPAAAVRPRHRTVGEPLRRSATTPRARRARRVDRRALARAGGDPTPASARPPSASTTPATGRCASRRSAWTAS